MSSTWVNHGTKPLTMADLIEAAKTLRSFAYTASADALADATWLTSDRMAQGMDLYFCPHCGYKLASRYAKDDKIEWCWGECLELYGEPIPCTFVRGIGPGRPESGCPF